MLIILSKCTNCVKLGISCLYKYYVYLNQPSTFIVHSKRTRPKSYRKAIKRYNNTEKVMQFDQCKRRFGASSAGPVCPLGNGLTVDLR